jgi:hypothetical protein
MQYLVSVIDDKSGLATDSEMSSIPSTATEGSRACNRMVEVRPFLGR